MGMAIKNKCYVIAEAGLNHNGSMDIAKRLIDVAKKAGADAVKFQKRTVDVLATKEILDAYDDRFLEFGSTYREIREHLEFDRDQYLELKNYAEYSGLDFIVTAFDIQAVNFLLEIGIDVFKLASHSLTNYDLLTYLAKKRKKTILSTGMCELSEVDRAVDIFKKFDCPLSLMHCVSAYPTPLDECNLLMMSNLRDRYHLPTGYSGHELGFFPSLVAVSMGAELVERHYTLDKNMTGFDHKMSLDPQELAAMIKDIRLVSQIHGTGVKEVSEAEWITRRKYHVSAVSSVPINAGEIITEKHITFRNPGTGIPRKHLGLLVGKMAKDNIDVNVLLNVDMFE
ncbi:N-acetylneuraminate synthase family protein [Alphaproteobacteria bacterium]|nr:N-acetylneuraminate synthase family protein [Alphaproteobacteria bacterium]MDC1157094.1 N-acetylneuraminate synthase family protein [Alphaproteobacteria bacterium]